MSEGLDIALEKWGIANSQTKTLGGRFGNWQVENLLVRQRPAASLSTHQFVSEIQGADLPIAKTFEELKPVTVGAWRFEPWEYVEGERGLISIEHAREYVVALDQLHIHSSLAGLSTADTRHVSKLQKRQAQERASRVLEYFSSIDMALIEDTLIHGDLYPNNIVSTERGVSFIDLDTLGRGHAWWDRTEMLVLDEKYRPETPIYDFILSALELDDIDSTIASDCAELRRDFRDQGL